MEPTLICSYCDSAAVVEDGDGFFYCQECGAQAPDIMVTGDANEDFNAEGKLKPTHDPKYTRRPPSQPITPLQPRTEASMPYRQFLSKLTSSQITEQRNLPDVKIELGNLDSMATETVDFGADTLSYEGYYEETRDRYVKGLLMMITYQCDALVEKFNVTPLIIGLVAPICLRFMALSGVYDDDWADKTIQDSELIPEGQERKVKRNRNNAKPTKEEEEEVREVKRNRHKGEPRNLYGKRAVTIWVSLLRKSLPLSSSLAISLLACHKAGAPILVTDIVRWAHEGKLPYLSCFLKIREQMGETSAACPVGASKMFRPFHIVSAQMLEVQAASIADIIGLPLPPVNFYGIASNYLKRLSIPEDKVLELTSLIQNWSMPPDLYLSKNGSRLPTRVCVMSILIVAIRMHYNINGFGAWERSLGLAKATEPDDDEEVSETKSESSNVTKATDFHTEELLKNLEAKYHELAAETAEYEKYLLSFLSLGKNELFAGLDEDSPDDTYRIVKNLWNGYSKDEESNDLETPQKRGRDREDDLSSLNELFLDDINKNSPRSSSRRTETGTMEHHHDLSFSDHNHQEENSKEITIKRLKINMAENLFRYIPPRVKVKRLDYLQYVRKREDGALIYAAHADYYILLRVCAKVAEVDVRNMHRGVLSFERRLGWIEKRIDQVLSLTPPFMTCEHCCDGGNEDDDDDDLIL